MERGVADDSCMARLPRPDIAHVPQHVVQRGNNRMPCFFDDDDRRRYLNVLREASLRRCSSIHAYVCMSNQAHPLASPLRKTIAGQAVTPMHSARTML